VAGLGTQKGDHAMNKSNALFLTLALSVVGLPQSSPALAAAFTENQESIFPIDIVVIVSCAAAGAGEVVELSGNLHDQFDVTINNNLFHIKFHDNPQGVVGTGLTTGDKYQGTGVTQSETNLGVGQQLTTIDNFRIIGQGPGNNFLVHDNFHITVNANGTVTSFHDNFSVECK
jgi:hypothetical protein